jgi:hypothetical protein
MRNRFRTRDAAIVARPAMFLHAALGINELHDNRQGHRHVRTNIRGDGRTDCCGYRRETAPSSRAPTHAGCTSVALRSRKRRATSTRPAQGVEGSRPHVASPEFPRGAVRVSSVIKTDGDSAIDDDRYRHALILRRRALGHEVLVDSAVRSPHCERACSSSFGELGTRPRRKRRGVAVTISTSRSAVATGE